MIIDIQNFKLNVSNFGKAIVPEKHAQLCKRIAVRLHRNVVAGCPENVKGTPVDSGWARANWGFYVGRNCPTDTVGVKPPEGSPVLPANAFFKNIADLQISVQPFIWIYNNVPYIEPLENGHSQQAPTGMMANALNDIQTFVDNL